MPCASHSKAAENHEAAAIAHHIAAELREKGDEKKALAESNDAKCCCGTAQKAADDAREKSTVPMET